jgi:hypothetical protein
MRSILLILAAGLIAAGSGVRLSADESGKPQIRAVWEKNFLTISGDHLPGPIRVNYLEAYCRPGSTDRDWGLTVIKHQAELVSVSDEGRVIRLRDKLADGVVVEHTLTVAADEIDFHLTAHNPTETPSLAHWAQPCIRVDAFTGSGKDDARALVPDYARKCFLFIDGKLTRLPTDPWAKEARYTPGQVYCPKHVDRDDVNPRPLSSFVPSNGLCGCFSADDRWIMATAFEPYQEIFQGVIACIHNDFRLGGLASGETKKIRGKIYVVPNDIDALVERFERDFPEQAAN